MHAPCLSPPAAGLPGGPTSPYWGVSGELWDPSDRLIDWSYAGRAGDVKYVGVDAACMAGMCGHLLATPG
jgi:hypothetical protein